jgi:hypothetical protein
MNDTDDSRAREAYDPPETRKVKLVRGELAVAVCKTQTAVTGPTTGCFRSNCKNRGS